MNDPTFTSLFEPQRRTPIEARDGRSRCLIVFAFGSGLCVLCEPGPALNMMDDGGGASIDGFVVNGVDYEPPPKDGVYYAELTWVDDGPESWEMPHIRNFLPALRDVRLATEEEWRSHLKGEWPEAWGEIRGED